MSKYLLRKKRIKDLLVNENEVDVSEVIAEDVEDELAGKRMWVRKNLLLKKSCFVITAKRKIILE